MLLAFGGPLWTSEQWSCSIRSDPNFGDGNQLSQGALDEIWPAVATWFQSATSPIASHAKLGWLKFNRIGANGKYVNSTTYRKDWATPLATGVSNASAPQVSLVATLETGASRGRAHRGRIYLPAPRYPLENDGRITAASATAAATSVAGLLTTLNGIASYGSNRVYSNIDAGTSRVITGVTVGRVLDTMRSRRTSLPEERTAVVTVGGS
jgi:hypothetical protein